MPPVQNATEDELREKLIDSARQGWIDRLIDLSRRNNLLYYKPLQSGTIDTHVPQNTLKLLMSGKALPIRSLVTDTVGVEHRVREIYRKALENSEEKGLSTLYLALGKASWPAKDGGRDPEAPVVLLPIIFKLKGQDLSAIEVQTNGEPAVNPILLHVLKNEFDVALAPEHLIGALSDSGDREGSKQHTLPESNSEILSISVVLNRLTEAAHKITGFKTEAFAVIGNFAFQKLAMVNDLENRRAEILQNDIVASIAGDSLARSRLGRSQFQENPRNLDLISPDDEFQVLDADSSQQCAIRGIAAGQSAVVHGPPGTGKSQTITNLIATLTANGKKVLFVAEKRAALEVVMNRLHQVGLDHLAIDLHGAEQTPAKVLEKVSKTLAEVREARLPECDSVHHKFMDRRSRLNEHDRDMHSVHQPANATVFDMQGALLRIPSTVNSKVRWRGADLAQITNESSAKILDLLQEAAGFEALFTRQDPSPWNGVTILTGDVVQAAIDLVASLSYSTLPALRKSLGAVLAAANFNPPDNLSEIDVMMRLLDRTHEVLTRYDPDVFSPTTAALFQAMAPGRLGGLKAAWLRLVNSSYRQAVSRAVLLRKGTKAGGAELFRELTEAQQIHESWQGLCGFGTNPISIANRVDCEAALAVAVTELNALQAIVNRLNWKTCSLAQIEASVGALAEDKSTPYRLLRLSQIEQQLRSLGVQALVDDIRQNSVGANLWPFLFQYVWLHSTLDVVASHNPSIRGFVGSTHDAFVAEFKDLDSKRLKLAADRVRRSHAERAIAVMNAHPDQEHIIRAEAAKSRRHKPLRKIFGQAAEVLTAVCPCWMASPLSVSQLIEATGIFDFVIFDEASQVLPEDAIPAILRGKHLIVAGDNKQLPPTTFFSASDDEDGQPEGEADGYESLLDMMIPFVKSFYLNWHYRSRDESLIAFSNHYIYDDRLVTFPGPGGCPAISHVLVEGSKETDGQEDSSGPEVTRVVELAIDHAKNNPSKTLGVITMGIKHALRIQGLLDKTLSKYPELAEFFDPGRAERFFIKNLERVQGDERDSIILSVGYGKDRGGNLPLRFGPILSSGGRRRLNVAVTRARYSVTVVSSFAYSDIDSTRVKSGTGLDFLRNYLQYAASGSRVFALGEMTNEPMNDFEADVFDALSSKGMKLVPQVGCSKYRIDLAAAHPANPGQFVLAIECDGATYHSSYTARDRDRLRQAQLENLGWTFHRIWSTDWFMRKDEEVLRAVKAFDRAVAELGRQKQINVIPPAEKQPESSSERVPASNPSRPSLPIPLRSSISDYTSAEMQMLLTWVHSDGKLRTNDELADEMFAALPFNRRGARIEAALRDAISRGPR